MDEFNKCASFFLVSISILVGVIVLFTQLSNNSELTNAFDKICSEYGYSESTDYYRIKNNDRSNKIYKIECDGIIIKNKNNSDGTFRVKHVYKDYCVETNKWNECSSYEQDKIIIVK